MEHLGGAGEKFGTSRTVEMRPEPEEARPVRKDTPPKDAVKSKGSETRFGDRMKQRMKRGMVVLGLLLLGALVLVLLGVHLGANGEGAWYAESVVWVVNLFSSSP